LWFRVFWASATVTEVVEVPTLRWLLTLGLISLIFLIFFVALLSGTVFGEEGPCRIVVYNPDAYSVSLVYLVLLHPGCQHLPSLLPAQKGWKIVVHAHGGSACSKVGTLACGRAPLLGLAFRSTLRSILLRTLTILVILLGVVWRTP